MGFKTAMGTARTTARTGPYLLWNVNERPLEHTEKIGFTYLCP
jgi:hypothetical protein